MATSSKGDITHVDIAISPRKSAMRVPTQVVATDALISRTIEELLVPSPAFPVLLVARKHLEARDYVHALTVIDDARPVCSRNTALDVLKGLVLFSLGREITAEATLGKAFDNEPHSLLSALAYCAINDHLRQPVALFIVSQTALRCHPASAMLMKFRCAALMNLQPFQALIDMEAMSGGQSRDTWIEANLSALKRRLKSRPPFSMTLRSRHHQLMQQAVQRYADQAELLRAVAPSALDTVHARMKLYWSRHASVTSFHDLTTSLFRRHNMWLALLLMVLGSINLIYNAARGTRTELLLGLLVSILPLTATVLVANRLRVRLTIAIALLILGSVVLSTVRSQRAPFGTPFEIGVAHGIELTTYLLAFVAVLTAVRMALNSRLRRRIVGDHAYDSLVAALIVSIQMVQLQRALAPHTWYASLEHSLDVVAHRVLSLSGRVRFTSEEIKARIWHEASRCAHAFRVMATEVISEGPEALPRVERRLMDAAEHVVTGKLGMLPRADALPARQRNVRKDIKRIGLATLVASAPLGVFLTLDSYVGLPDDTSAWLLPLGATWFVVSLLSKLDPDFERKATTTKDLLTAERNAP